MRPLGLRADIVFELGDLGGIAFGHWRARSPVRAASSSCNATTRARRASTSRFSSSAQRLLSLQLLRLCVFVRHRCRSR